MKIDFIPGNFQLRNLIDGLLCASHLKNCVEYRDEYLPCPQETSSVGDMGENCCGHLSQTGCEGSREAFYKW